MNIVQSVFERQELNSDQFAQGVYLGDLAPYLRGLYRRELFDDYIFQLCIENKLLIGEDWITNLYVGKKVNKVLSLNIGVCHMSMFCQQGTKLVILRKADAINEYQLAINEMLNVDITYIDVHHSTLARTGNESWMGSFYVYPSNKLRQWAGLSFTRMPV